jgi:hypothetical protein
MSALGGSACPPKSTDTDTLTLDQINAVKYRGPLYFDFDGNDIAEVTEKFQQFLGKLTELDVDLDMVRLYATGGRGYHALAPSELFLPKARPAGVVKLPLIYR